jgi:GH15 family glucan-1,4-alpha-glucosidase
VGDNQWGHLQIDATSIFLLFLAQMTVSGLHIIYTLDEVQFVQNLVFYIERGYRTPDYGIWERGNKINHGQPELNCSSIGMVVAALQAINGINLFGSRGGPSSVIHVLPDEIARNFTTLHSALPRESPSKEIDAALLAVISFPAFAVADPELRETTRKAIERKLGGKYGCKRFLRDGHQTVLEDHNRLHYEPHELKIFENVESEWPLFFTYLILDGLFRGDHKQTEHYRAMLKPLLLSSQRFTRQSDDEKRDLDESTEIMLVPELYIVPVESIEAERLNPGSQDRIPNPNVPLVWAQSLYILGNLIYDNLLSTADVDPLGLRLKSPKSGLHSETVFQIVLLAENTELQSKLLMYGLETHTIENCAPITISKPSSLRHAYSYLGKNSKLVILFKQEIKR